MPHSNNNAPARSVLPVLIFAGLAVLAAAAALEWWLLHPGSESSQGQGSSVPGYNSSSITRSSATGAQEAQSGAGGGSASSAGSELPEQSPAITAAQEERQATKVTRGLAVRPEGGLLVTGVPPGSVTGQLALQPGDVILQVNGTQVATLAEFNEIYRQQGLPRQLEILRDGRILHRH